MEKSKTVPRPTATVFQFKEEKNKRDKKTTKDSTYKPDFSKFNKYLERSLQTDVEKPKNNK